MLIAAGVLLAACSADEPVDPVVDPIASPTSTAVPDSSSTSQPPITSSTTLPPLTLGKGFSLDPCINGLPTLGCISLGTITDETGPAQFDAPGYFAGAQAFWANRNRLGGVAESFSVEVLRAHKRDAADQAEQFASALESIEPEVAALSHVIGARTVTANMASLVNSALVAAPVDQWSGWAFLTTDVGAMLESGASWCVHGFNAVDRERPVGLISDLSPAGRDFAAGARAAAAAGSGLRFDIEVTPIAEGGDPSQQAVVAEILSSDPDAIVMATGPSEAGAIIGGAVLAGYRGSFTILEDTFTPALIDASSGVRSVFMSDQVRVISGHLPWQDDSTGHRAMREAAGSIGIPDSARRAFQVGWVSQYPLLAAIEGAIEAQDLDRRGIVSAAARVTEVDYEGMLPPWATGVPHLASVLLQVDPDAPDLFAAVSDFLTADAFAEGYTEPCSTVG